MQKYEPVCLDCDHAYELHNDAATIACGAHLEYRAANHPATCAQYAPKEPLAQLSVTEIWHEQ